MSNASAEKMDTDAFLAAFEGHGGKWELRDGRPVAMSPERAGHARTKAAAHFALATALARHGSPCEAFPDGMTVRVDAGNAYEPDVVVNCGPPLPGDAVEVRDPKIIVEVLSPSTAALDLGRKLSDYFSLSSVEHYLILDPDRRVAIHHKRGQGDAIETRVLAEGALRFDPPGIEVAVVDLFAPI